MTARGSARSRGDPGLVTVLLTHRKVIEHIRSFAEGREGRAYVVGGFMRDIHLNRLSSDLDIVVGGIEPEKVAFRLHRDLGFSRPVVFKRFQTALTAGEGIEVEICRLDGDIKRDAARRDFTVNCLYADIVASGATFPPAAVADPTGRAVSDLNTGVLRAASEPCFTLWLDPLRVLRAIRFYAILGFSIERELLQAMPRMVYLLSRVSPERIRTELESILLSRRLRSALSLMQRVGVSDIAFPELGRTYGFSQATPHHAYDLFTHAVKTSANTPPDLTLRLAGLLHDIGKYETRKCRGGRAVYYGHETASAAMAETILKRLKFPKRLVRDVVFLIRNHMINYSEDWSDKAVRRFVRRMGAHREQMLKLVEADRKAQRPEPGMADSIRHLRRRITELSRDDRMPHQLPVDGLDIMKILGIDEGPAVGRAKDYLWEAATKRGKPMTRQDCVRLLKAWAERVDLA